jgi:hypothetical protein
MDEKNVGPAFVPEKISKTWSFEVSYGACDWTGVWALGAFCQQGRGGGVTA